MRYNNKTQTENGYYDQEIAVFGDVATSCLPHMVEASHCPFQAVE